jgi:hypothetical protein
MTVKHTLQEREKELRSLIATPAGREELQELASRYHHVSNLGSGLFRTKLPAATRNPPRNFCKKLVLANLLQCEDLV